MLKPASLRAHIEAALPEVREDPDRLRIWLDRGSIRSRNAGSFAFEWRYVLNVLLIDWTRHPSLIAALIVEWANRHQPAIVGAHDAGGIRFQADIIDKATIDLAIEIDLTESVGVVPRDGGGWEMVHHAEPETLLPDNEPLHPSGPTLAELHWQGGPLIEAGLIDAGMAQTAMWDGVIDAGTPVYARRLIIRHGTAAEWQAANPVLRLGEPGLENDSGQVKYGDGQSPWNALPYAGGPRWQVQDW